MSRYFGSFVRSLYTPGAYTAYSTLAGNLLRGEVSAFGAQYGGHIGRGTAVTRRRHVAAFLGAHRAHRRVANRPYPARPGSGYRRGSRGMRGFGKRRRFSGSGKRRGRRGRKKSMGTRSWPTKVMPPRKVKANNPTTYYPPVGVQILKGGKHHTQGVVKVCFDSRYFLDDLSGTGAQSNCATQISAALSDFALLTTAAPATGVRCPDFYAAIDGWESFTFVGLKLEIFARPKVVYGIITWSLPGRCWSLSSEANSNTAQPGSDIATLSQTGSTGTGPPVYPTVERASEDPSFRPAVFLNGAVENLEYCRSHPYRFFKRYMRVDYDVKKREGMNVIQQTGVIANAPGIVFTQNNQYVTHYVPECQFIIQNNQTFDWIVRRTAYLRVYDRVQTALCSVPTCQRPGVEPFVQFNCAMQAQSSASAIGCSSNYVEPPCS